MSGSALGVGLLQTDRRGPPEGRVTKLQVIARSSNMECADPDKSGLLGSGRETLRYHFSFLGQKESQVR